MSVEGNYITHDLIVTGIVGAGCFGSVFKGISSTGGDAKTVAIKQIKIEHKAAYIRSACREVRILSKASHPNVIKLYRVLHKGEHLFMVTDLYFGDLTTIIKSDFLYCKIKSEEIVMIAFQIFSGLEYLHSMGIIHRDIKPSNFMIDFDMTIKIGDFGSARSICGGFLKDSAGDIASNYLPNAFTDYVVTRWYRAPEIICTVGNYGFAQDVWATGCVLAELLNRTPLFPGSSSIAQMELMFKAFGVPCCEDLEFVVDEDAYAWISGQDTLAPFAGLASMISPSRLTAQRHGEFISLLETILVFNPQKRISSKDALESPLFVEARGRMTQSQPRSMISSLADVINLRDIETCPNSRTQLLTILKTDLKRLQLLFDLSEKKGIVDVVAGTGRGEGKEAMQVQCARSLASTEQRPSLSACTQAQAQAQGQAQAQTQAQAQAHRPLSAPASSAGVKKLAGGMPFHHNMPQPPSKASTNSPEYKQGHKTGPGPVPAGPVTGPHPGPGVASRVWGMLFSSGTSTSPPQQQHAQAQRGTAFSRQTEKIQFKGFSETGEINPYGCSTRGGETEKNAYLKAGGDDGRFVTRTPKTTSYLVDFCEEDRNGR